MVEGLPPSQFKIAKAYYGRVILANGRWVNVQDLGLQVRGASTPAQQHFKLVYSRPGGKNFDPRAPLKTYGVDDFYLMTTC